MSAGPFTSVPLSSQPLRSQPRGETSIPGLKQRAIVQRVALHPFGTTETPKIFGGVDPTDGQKAALTLFHRETYVYWT